MQLDRAAAPGVVARRFRPTLMRAQFLRDSFSRRGLAPSVAARFGRRFGRLYTHSDEILQPLVEVRIARNVECLPHVRQQSVRTPFPEHSSVPDPQFFGTLACVRGGRSRRRSLRRAVGHLRLIHVRLACSAWAFLGTGRGTSRYQADGPWVDLPATDVQPSRRIVISTTGGGQRHGARSWPLQGRPFVTQRAALVACPVQPSVRSETFASSLAPENDSSNFCIRNDNWIRKMP